MSGLIPFGLEQPMRFSKYKGRLIKDVPLSFWLWLYRKMEGTDNNWNNSWRAFIEDNIGFYVMVNHGEVDDAMVFLMEKMHENREIRLAVKAKLQHQWEEAGSVPADTDNSINDPF